MLRLHFLSGGLAEMPGQQPTFLHRANRDGTFDSICLRCFHTIATETNEAALAGAEMEHQCVPSALTTPLPKIWKD